MAKADISHLDTVGIEVNGRGHGGERVDLPEVALGREEGGYKEEYGRHGRRKKREDKKWRSTGGKKINRSR